MKRLEIFANRALEEDIMDKLRSLELDTEYTKIPIVHGVGNSGPRMGDHIWPEENFSIVMYCDNSKAEKIRSCIQGLKEQFPDEGIKLFELG